MSTRYTEIGSVLHTSRKLIQRDQISLHYNIGQIYGFQKKTRHHIFFSRFAENIPTYGFIKQA